MPVSRWKIIETEKKIICSTTNLPKLPSAYSIPGAILWVNVGIHNIGSKLYLCAFLFRVYQAHLCQPDLALHYKRKALERSSHRMFLSGFSDTSFRLLNFSWGRIFHQDVDFVLGYEYFCIWGFLPVPAKRYIPEFTNNLPKGKNGC